MRLNRKLVWALVCVAGLCCGALSAAPLAKITVAAGDVDRIDTPLCVSLDAVGLDRNNSGVFLVEISDRRQRTPAQINASRGELCWILQGKTAAGTTRSFEVVRTGRKAKNAIEIIKTNKHLDIQIRTDKVLRYNHALMPPPEGQDPLYTRSGFIHPLWSPAGAVLTNIHPKDHYHHLGVWMPWTMATFEGRDIDFWNLKKGNATVRFVKFGCILGRGLVATNANRTTHTGTIKNSLLD